MNTTSHSNERIEKLKGKILTHATPIRLDALRDDWYLTPSQYDRIKKENRAR